MSNICEDASNSPELDKNITYNDVAAKLLKDKFLLTALELHTELVESGRELAQLKGFFSNPGNFEFQSQDETRLSRSESQATLDSLDLTRYSEDEAATDEKVAVLEFELRKAKETINALRNNLTMATESQTSTPDKTVFKCINIGAIKPHEQRALNFLINEYLLLHGYKLTSITFADENQKQDFDDWDDVGLNVAKPPELLMLYREALKQTGHTCCSVCVQTDFPNNDKLTEEIGIMQTKISELTLKLEQAESNYSYIKNINMNLCKENEFLSSQVSELKEIEITNQPPTTKDSLESESPSEKFEIIDKNMSYFKKESIHTLDDNVSESSFTVNDWTNLTVNPSVSNDIEFENANERDVNSSVFNVNVREPFEKDVFSLCYVNIPRKVDNEILDEVLNQSITKETLVHILSLSLPRIIPNIILNKREESIPLLLCAIQLNDSSNERDKLLQLLFNLKKKPSDSERMLILTGIVSIARHSEELLVENEILPQCWEQLTHRLVERRLLVAEACTALIPYVSSSIRNSLMLSMLQQMLDDREEIVREAVVRAVSLVMVLCNDSDKYNQCEEIALNILDDPCARVVNLSIKILFTVLGRWALMIGRLQTSLFKQLLHKLNEILKDSEVPNKCLNQILSIIDVLATLQPLMLMCIASRHYSYSKFGHDTSVSLRPELENVCSKLTNPLSFYKSEVNVGMMLDEFENLLNTKNTTWPELEWFIHIMIPDLLNNLNHVDGNEICILNSFINLFSRICIVFGKTITVLKIRPILKSQIDSIEQLLSNFNQFSPSLNVIPIYLISVLCYCDDKEELASTFKKFLCALPLCGISLSCLEIAAKGICDANFQEIVILSLWEGVVHQRPLIRAAAANLFSVVIKNCNSNLLRLKVTPALVTLANDADVLVRTAAIPALGTLITDCDIEEIHDKVYLQIQNYLLDPNFKENHMLLRELIVTFGNIFNCCTPQFRRQVIVPQLNVLSTYALQMKNQTKKVDLAVALIETFAAIAYSSVGKDDVGPVIMQGLRSLELMVTENHSMYPHRETVLAMIREYDNKINVPSTEIPIAESSKSNPNHNYGVRDVKQRVNQIFNKSSGSKPNTLQSLQGLLKKK